VSVEFAAWPKTPRLFRDMVITEKIDGTNAAVIIERADAADAFVADDDPNRLFIEHYDGLMTPTYYEVAAQSRKRLITPADDNFGFASWVRSNAFALFETLGEGRHYGEWWGSGIQRGYGLSKGEKRFSLFNVNRYDGIDRPDLGLSTVPVLYQGPFTTKQVREVLGLLESEGSAAAPGFSNPEGIIVFHAAAGQVFKVTIEGDEAPKSVLPR
jgi:hypothetical protein